jgi:hypothetical protein
MLIAGTIVVSVFFDIGECCPVGSGYFDGIQFS